MSRFDRTASGERKPSPALASAGGDHSAEGTGGSIEDLNLLQERLTKIQERRIRREVDLENARRDLDECQRTAETLGVNTLEELEAKVAQLRQEDERAMREFMEALTQEEEMLDDFDRRLSALERQ